MLKSRYYSRLHCLTFNHVFSLKYIKTFSGETFWELCFCIPSSMIFKSHVGCWSVCSDLLHWSCFKQNTFDRCFTGVLCCVQTLAFPEFLDQCRVTRSWQNAGVAEPAIRNHILATKLFRAFQRWLTISKWYRGSDTKYDCEISNLTTS